jgi:hypothetical protein
LVVQLTDQLPQLNQITERGKLNKSTGTLKMSVYYLLAFPVQCSFSSFVFIVDLLQSRTPGDGAPGAPGLTAHPLVGAAHEAGSDCATRRPPGTALGSVR